MIADGTEHLLRYKTPLFPYVTLFGIWSQVLCLILMAFEPDLRMALYAGVPMLILPMVVYHFRGKHQSEVAGAAH